MLTTKLFIWSRKLHRLFLLVVTFLTIVMAITGSAMKYFVGANIFGLNSSAIRYLHNQLSLIFTVTLAAMMFSGLYMYLFPILIARSRKRRAAAENLRTPPPPAD
ncbi:MAG: hypothetical protein V1846_03620 [Candidatus Komeilibacteria bacterium]